MSDAPKFDVIVIGCGTAGLVLAQQLATDGIRVAAVDRWRLPVSFPKATHLDDETMRAFQTLGLAHIEPTFSRVGMYRFYDPEWRPVMEFDMQLGETDQGWQSDYMFHQPDFEATLRGTVHEAPAATTFFGWQLSELEESGERVTAVLRDVVSGAEIRIDGAFVVGCDGANSTVRQLMGWSQTDYGATHRSLIIDVHPFTPATKLPERDSFIRAGIRNPFTYVPIAHPRLRFEELLRPEDDVAEFERLDHVYEVLSDWLRPSEYRILRADVYEWRAVIASPWRAGRVLLAGDACHEMPPHTGQGMCSGIRDAFNLAWKLRRIVRGESSPDLLETYETERSPHIEVFVQTAAEMAKEIETMQSLPPQEGPPPVTTRGQLRPRLGAGVFNEDDPWGGRLAAQPRIADGTLLDDTVGFQFAIVGDQATLDEAARNVGVHWGRLGVRVIRDSSDQVGAWLERLNATAVLVRPDRYVFGTARTPGEVEALTTRLEALI